MIIKKNITNLWSHFWKNYDEISLKKDDYQGFDVFKKIFNLYKFSTIFIESVGETGINKRLQNNDNENDNKKQEENGNSFNIILLYLMKKIKMAWTMKTKKK